MSNRKTIRFLQAAIEYDGDDCLIWPFARNSAGYAHFWLNGKNLLAHRYVCEKVRGPAPPDKPMALHACASGRLGCIAPRHLKWKRMADHQVKDHAGADWRFSARSRACYRASKLD